MTRKSIIKMKRKLELQKWNCHLILLGDATWKLSLFVHRDGKSNIQTTSENDFFWFAGNLFGSIFVWSVLAARSAWRFANLCIFVMLWLLHYVRRIDDSNSRLGHWSVVGLVQLVDYGWNFIDSGIGFRHDHDDTILGKIDISLHTNLSSKSSIFCFIRKGLQSIHGLTEIISYLVRLVINCMALMCVIPTGLRWRREHQIMSQLENLANRMHLTSPENLQRLAAPSALTCINDSTRRKSLSRKRRPSQSSAYDNPAFISISAPQQSNHSNSNSSKNRQPQITLPIFPYYYGMYPSQNEFNASIFGLDPSHLVGPLPQISGEHVPSSSW